MNNIDAVSDYMQEHRLLLVTAESCTAGLIAARLVDSRGAGEILDCAFVTYSPAAKQRCLDVNEATIKSYGLTSEQVSIEMAHGALARSKANVAIANTGVTEPMPKSPPEGTQCFAWVFSLPHAAAQVFSETRKFDGERNEVRAASADYALARLVRLHARLIAAASGPVR
ncbi:CinA family protein [Eoetvoesiella caeni]